MWVHVPLFDSLALLWLLIIDKSRTFSELRAFQRKRFRVLIISACPLSLFVSQLKNAKTLQEFGFMTRDESVMSNLKLVTTLNKFVK